MSSLLIKRLFLSSLEEHWNKSLNFFQEPEGYQDIFEAKSRKVYFRAQISRNLPIFSE